MEVACGQCLGCRLDRSRMWAMRIVHESSLYEITGGNCFITLTYRDELEADYDQKADALFIPDDWSLHREHFVKFMKRLRRWVFSSSGLGRVAEYDEDGNLLNGVRYFMCGEYGRICRHGFDLNNIVCPVCNVGRPHYHACLFNCSFNDLESYGSSNCELRYTSRKLSDLWQYGFVAVGS